MNEFDEEFDFIVAGSGGGSMCAALYLHSLGKRVLILEKTALVGGTTARSGGVGNLSRLRRGRFSLAQVWS